MDGRAEDSVAVVLGLERALDRHVEILGLLLRELRQLGVADDELVAGAAADGFPRWLRRTCLLVLVMTAGAMILTLSRTGVVAFGIVVVGATACCVSLTSCCSRRACLRSRPRSCRLCFLRCAAFVGEATVAR
jgi:hypothetical protein